jgi:hypothetical protein
MALKFQKFNSLLKSGDRSNSHGKVDLVNKLHGYTLDQTHYDIRYFMCLLMGTMIVTRPLSWT